MSDGSPSLHPHAAVPETPLHLFEATGVELEYILVDRESLGVLPVSDRVLEAVSGSIEAEVEMGPVAWSNELVLHVLELKTNGPARDLVPYVDWFQNDIRRINQILAPLGGRLMPTGMHPWMNPSSETRLWPHDYGAVYEAFDRIFDCRGHGWSNLQSMHVNLPFAGDKEFARLHAAIRLVLPILPALAASSPIVERRRSGWLDSRMELYRHNARAVPSVSGRIIPEAVFSAVAYDEEILQRIYRDLAPRDPEGILRHEWVNGRGAIARFDRSAIEIRVIDVQECVLADLAICAATTAIVRMLVEERWSSLERQKAAGTETLAEVLFSVIAAADETTIEDVDYLELLGWSGERPTAGRLWDHLIEEGLRSGTLGSEPWGAPLEVMLSEGCLARRIVRALGDDDSPPRLAAVYRELCDCLEQGRMYRLKNSFQVTPS